MASAPAPIVILACGNPSRGDDALGPQLLERLHDWLLAEGLSERYELIGDFQWQIENALDLAGRELALFIDADQQAAAPYAFRRVEASDAPSFAASSHALNPETVLAVLARLGQAALPPTYVLGVRGDSFVLGDELSPTAREHAEAAFAFLQAFCRAPQTAAWCAAQAG
ncbi:MAG: hydrogenase maturation protease [Candidatus Accumulibacter sp.]|uniref:hydrogenase maturation protease n=1 Tax=Accumulibacter sp. TaxID=2053492 RepID=UPI00287B0EC4|nr:hydrogenase maturation protease [Accumulibacter sp.]MDS4015615.1 hydrogenase maturation protease [Accumulibacter sp.]